MSKRAMFLAGMLTGVILAGATFTCAKVIGDARRAEKAPQGVIIEYEDGCAEFLPLAPEEVLPPTQKPIIKGELRSV